jgi:putative transcriptional regulator
MTGEEIRELRQRLGMSMEEFAHELGTSTSTVFRWEKGQHKPGRMAIKLLTIFQEKASKK